jgi:hypothetical protein
VLLLRGSGCGWWLRPPAVRRVGFVPGVGAEEVRLGVVSSGALHLSDGEVRWRPCVGGLQQFLPLVSSLFSLLVSVPVMYPYPYEYK